MDSAVLMTGITTTAFAALLAAVGWLINNQNQTNKALAKGLADISSAFTEAVADLKSAMILYEERSQNQKTLCQMYRDVINQSHKDLKTQVGNMENKANHQNQN